VGAQIASDSEELSDSSRSCRMIPGGRSGGCQFEQYLGRPGEIIDLSPDCQALPPQGIGARFFSNALQGAGEVDELRRQSFLVVKLTLYRRRSLQVVLCLLGSTCAEVGGAAIPPDPSLEPAVS
jgi:hypothetical protein